MRFLPLLWSLPLQKHLTFRTNKIIQFLFTHIHHHHPLLREEASTTKRNFLQCSSLPTPSSTLIKSWTREEATHWGNHWSGNSQPPWKPPPGSGSHARQFHSDSQFPTCRLATGLSWARESGAPGSPLLCHCLLSSIHLSSIWNHPWAGAENTVGKKQTKSVPSGNLKFSGGGSRQSHEYQLCLFTIVWRDGETGVQDSRDKERGSRKKSS